MKKITIELDVFKADYVYIYDCSYKELEKYCRRHYKVVEDDNFEHLSGADGTTFCLNRKNGGFDRIIWLEDFKTKPYFFGVLVHETTHAVIRMLEWKGIPFTSRDNQDETFAYIMDFLVTSFLREFRKKK